MRIFIPFAVCMIVLFLISCSQKQEITESSEYPKQIDSLQVRELYDTARLYLFTWLCDKKVDDYYRGEFELKYKSFFKRNDTIELFFLHFLPKGRQDSTYFSDYVHQSSIAFNIKSKRKLWGWDINGFSDALQPGDARFENPTTPEVVNFIRDHKDILDSSFRELARKAHLLTE